MTEGEEIRSFELRFDDIRLCHLLGIESFMGKGMLEMVKALGCPMYVTIDMNSLTEEEQLDFKRAMEKKYNRRLRVGESEEYINLSLH